MTIYLTGDIHGSLDIRKLGRRHFDSTGLTRDDYMVILGDFGLVWHNPPSSEERYWLDWLEECPWTTLFIDGNHENHVLLNSFLETQWCNGRVHKVREHVLHLMRGEIFNIDGSTFFCMGGAYSPDKEWRTPGVSWWEEEVPNDTERALAITTLENANWKVDYVLTHCPPLSALCDTLEQKDRASVVKDEYMEWLESLAARLDFQRWFYGHMHIDLPNKKPYTALYNDILQLLPNGKTTKLRTRKPLRMPPPEFPLGYSIQEIADHMECSFEEADQAISESLQGQTMGLHPDTGAILVYKSDITHVLRHLDKKLR